MSISVTRRPRVRRLPNSPTPTGKRCSRAAATGSWLCTSRPLSRAPTVRRCRRHASSAPRFASSTPDRRPWASDSSRCRRAAGRVWCGPRRRRGGGTFGRPARSCVHRRAPAGQSSAQRPDSQGASLLGSALSLKPLLCLDVDGRLVLGQRIRTATKAHAAMIDQVVEVVGDGSDDRGPPCRQPRCRRRHRQDVDRSAPADRPADCHRYGSGAGSACRCGRGRRVYRRLTTSDGVWNWLVPSGSDSPPFSNVVAGAVGGPDAV